MLYRDRLLPVKREITNNTRNTKNNTLAMDAAASTIPKNPKIPATTATMRKISDHFNMVIILSVFVRGAFRLVLVVTSFVVVINPEELRRNKKGD